MTGPDYPHLERVVPGPKTPDPGDYQRRERSGAVIVWLAGILVVVAFVLSVAAAASRYEPDVSPPPARSGASQDRSGDGASSSGNTSVEWPWKSSSAASRSVVAQRATESEGAETASGDAPRYRGTATWYCLSGSSACTRGYGPGDLVAAIDSDLGFAKGDSLTVRYRDRSVTVTVVDVCGCPGERLIDLTSGAFRRLAPLGHGVIPVTVEIAGASSTLPATEVAP